MEPCTRLVVTLCVLAALIYWQPAETKDAYNDRRKPPSSNSNSSDISRLQHCYPMSKSWLQKMKTYFKRKDANGDGVLTEDDYKKCADRMDAMRNVTRRQKEIFRKKMLDLYHNYARVAEKYGKSAVTEDVVIAAIYTQRALLLMPGGFNQLLKISTYAALDTDDNGVLSKNEYTKYFHILGLKNFEQIGNHSFHAIDYNHDRILTSEEYHTAFQGFFLYDDEKAPGNSVFGPLV